MKVHLEKSTDNFKANNIEANVPTLEKHSYNFNVKVTPHKNGKQHLGYVILYTEHKKQPNNAAR